MNETALPQKRRIGDVDVHPIGHGCMGFSEERSLGSRPASLATIAAGLDAGITLLDTANIYAPSWDKVGHNEELVAEAVHAWQASGLSSTPAELRPAPFIVTKGGLVRGPGETWNRDASTEGLLRAARASSRALGLTVEDDPKPTAAMDLYLLHRLDPALHVNTQIEALVAVQSAGLAQRIGLSNVTAAQLQRALDLGAPIVAVQNEFSLRFRQEADVIELCAEHGIAFMPWSPLGGSSTGAEVGGRYAAALDVARARSTTPQTVVLAWLLGLSPTVIPIPGATRISSVEAAAAAASLVLDRSEIEAISATVPEQISVFPDDVPAPPM